MEIDDLTDSSSESEQELFPIQASRISAIFNYNDPKLLNGILRAVVEDNCEQLQYLIQSGKSVNINDNYGNTALHVAVLKKNLRIIQLLLKNNDLRVNARNFYGETPIFLACKDSNIEITELLIKFHANLNLPNNEDVTPLHLAVNNPQLAHILIKNGANLNARDYSGETPLHEAVESNNLEVVCTLLYYNADANVHCDNNITPFMKSVIRENIDIQTVLIDYVVDFNDKTFDGMSILMLALTHSTPFVETIVDNGANVNELIIVDDFQQFDMLEMCLRVPNVNNFRLIWPKYRSQLHDTLGSVIFRLHESNIADTPYFKEYLNVILHSNNIEACINSALDYLDFGDIIEACYYDDNISIDFFTQLSIVLIGNGYPVCLNDLDTLFNEYGYCDLYKFMLHSPIDLSFTYQYTFSRLIYIVDQKIYDILKGFILSSQNISHHYRNSIFILIKYFVYPKLINSILKFCTSDYYAELNKCIKKLPTVPCLLELARNQARDYIIDKYKIKNCGQYLSTVNYMDISTVYKKILTFEKAIYT